MAGGIFPGLFNVAEPQAEMLQGQRDTQDYNLKQQMDQTKLKEAQDQQRFAGLNQFENEYNFKAWTPESKQKFITSLHAKHGTSVPTYEEAVAHHAELGKTGWTPELEDATGAKAIATLLKRPEWAAAMPEIQKRGARYGIDDITKASFGQIMSLAGAQPTGEPAIDLRQPSEKNTSANIAAKAPEVAARVSQLNSSTTLNQSRTEYMNVQAKYIPLKFRQLGDHYQRMEDAIDKRNDISEEQKNIERGKLNETRTQDAFNRGSKGQMTAADRTKMLELLVPKVGAHGRTIPPPQDVADMARAAIAGYDQAHPQGAGQAGGAKGHPHVDAAKKDPKLRPLYSKAHAKGLSDDQIEALLAK
jgi:hypothetical protein